MLLWSRDVHYCHIDFYRPNSVSAETNFFHFIFYFYVYFIDIFNSKIDYM
jgi:hypothetical protein